EIWFSWNPSKETDAVEKLFDESDDEDSVLVHVNYTDNPYCPDVMKRLAEKTRKRNFEKYNHVWLGGFNTRSEAMVFDHWRVDDFTPLKTWDGPYYGMDFGFSNDPSCFVRCYINDNTLYIDQDAGKVKLELDDTAAYFIKADPEVARHAMRADSARPESISYLKRNGLPRIVGVKKGAGSVEDGVEHINTYDEIVIHTRCEDMAAEAQDYSFKVNKGGDVTTDIVDADNHRWDAVRYALQPLIKKVNLIFEAL
ncbi:MAG: terminase large subunit, partial [Planctomycetes bacterium]|nr:terminase large subunit [Planctomycetota bacterium]